MLKDLNYADIAAHAAVAVLISALALIVGWWSSNAAFWIYREIRQRGEKGQPWQEAFTRPQVIAEWAVPSVIGVLMWAIF